MQKFLYRGLQNMSSLQLTVEPLININLIIFFSNIKSDIFNIHSQKITVNFL